MPNSDSRICSNHFPDGKITDANPYPTLHMGHTNIISQQNQDPHHIERYYSETPLKKGSI